MAATYFLSFPQTCFFPHLTNKSSFLPKQQNSSLLCCSYSSETVRLTDETIERLPSSANYHPSAWSYEMLEALGLDQPEVESKDKVKRLEEKVRSLLEEEDGEAITMLEMIDDIQRLGLDYRFKKEIGNAIDRYGEEVVSELGSESLHATALGFRLLRQHGFHVSQDVFKKFKDHEGNFKACLCHDPQGMLSLLEASYLAFEGETILEEALIFTQKYLKNLNLSKVDDDKAISRQVHRSLEIPLHRRMRRLEVRWYIDSYSTEKKGASQYLLALAKLDFNFVQSLHQKEIQELARWWKDMGLANKLSFARDRIMECFFWSVGMVPDPQLSYCRKELTKVAALVTTIDDIYDVYGTPDELESFTTSVERWDLQSLENLPDYMKLCFLALYNTVNEMGYNSLKERGENIIPYLTNAWADLCKAFLKEAKWNNEKTRPRFEEYIENAWVSCSGVLFLSHAYFLTEQDPTTQALDCFRNYHHDLLRSPSLIFRLCNDLSTSSAEIERGEVANSISCYMNDNDVTEEVAFEEMRDLIDKTWKKMNELRFYGTPFGRDFGEIASDLARISECHYQYGDGHGAPDNRAKNSLYKLFIEPIS